MPLHLASDPQPFLGQSLVWHGAFFVQHSLALVNRELSLALLDNPTFASRFTLGVDHFDTPLASLQNDPRFASLAARMGALPDNPDITLRHRWPPHFERTGSGKLVLIQPWEFGSLPRHWVDAIARNVDEVWVPSNFVRDTYTLSGVPDDKVVVVPNGVNTARFHPAVQELGSVGSASEQKPTRNTQHGTADTYKFLFVGGTIARKGIDVLLDAYDRAFTVKDDVVLIIKDFGADSFYANQGAVALIRALQAKPNGAKIVYLNEDMSEAEIASLYATCDCLVHPYRGEGYGLPIAEAMACGKPTIVTDFGAALDFANATNAYLIPSGVQRMSEKRIGDLPTVDYPFWADPNREALSALLRHVVANREEAQAKGAKAAQDIAAHHTWDKAAHIACERLIALADSPLVSGARDRFALPMGLGNLGLGMAGLNTGLGMAGLGGLNLPGMSPGNTGLAAAGDMYEDRKQAALGAARRGDWKNAVPELDACLIERPDDWDVVNALGVACFRLGDNKRALELLRHGLASAPNARDFHHNMAFVLLAQEEPETALEHALLALDMTPDDANLRRTVERTGEAVLKKARKLLRSVPDRQRAGIKRSSDYRHLMERYDRAQVALTAEVQNRSGEEETDTQRPTPNTLSLCMIVKNEERFLRNCLESVKGVVDEIVIVDTGSTDGTLDIAREYGAKIVPSVWNDDFSEARNVSLEHATGNWALWLDADEEIAPGTAQTFRDAMQTAPTEVGGYMVEFHNWLTSTTRPEPGQQTGAEMAVHHACRLFRRVPGVRFEGRIHEQNLRSLQSLGYTYARMEGLLIDHFGYAGEIMTLRNKHERFVRMLTREVEECPDEGFRHFHLFNLGNAYFTMGDMENAARNFEPAADGVQAEEEYAVTLFVEWASALHRLNRSWEGLDVCARADEMGIRQAGVEFARGYCLLHTQQYEAAEMAFRTAIDMGKDEALYGKTGDVGAATYKARYGLALALVGQDRHEEAMPFCYEALEEQANMIEARYLLTIILTQQDRTYEASQELETILQQSPGHEDASRDLGLIYYAAKDYAQALPHIRGIALRQPEDADAQGRLATCCEQLGLWDEAREAYTQMRALTPESAEICVNLGRILAETGAESEAIECFAEAIQINPEYGNAYFNAGDLMYKLGYYDRAAETYMAGLEVDPEHESGFFVLGNCFVHTQAYAAAVFSYRQALTQSPAHEEARSNLQLAEELARNVGQELPAA